MTSHQSMFSKRRSQVQRLTFAILLILGIVSSLSSSNLPESVKRSASSAPSSTLYDGSIQSRRDILAGASGLLIGSICVSPVKAEEDLSGSFKVLLTVQLDSTKSGEIEIEVLRSLAPLGAERFRKLVETGFYDDARYFRVLPGYVAQFGIASDPALNKE
uniref:peptidylprolyl isomerase n=1 Tax=Eucampia antarctica TaxID=49252 RepID=A0A7S2WR63_9STRA|mmetsp:Transcript_9595/g.9235  ORF Transcript_9595/g.9235 Transcript_9595/m.9235 type:complete len:160 (+) Transcript_9595:918-1397(+)